MTTETMQAAKKFNRTGKAHFVRFSSRGAAIAVCNGGSCLAGFGDYMMVDASEVDCAACRKLAAVAV